MVSRVEGVGVRVKRPVTRLHWRQCLPREHADLIRVPRSFRASHHHLTAIKRTRSDIPSTPYATPAYTHHRRQTAMSTSPFTNRRRLGRCPSPPTWAWYEQIPFPEDDSDNTDSCDDDNDSCSEDDEEYERHEEGAGDRPASPSESSSEGHRSEGGADAHGPTDHPVDTEMSEKVQHEGSGESDAGTDFEVKKDVKGKQRAVDPPEADESPRRRERRKKHREPVLKFRPILTIQRSHGFVWNQDLFVPPYIKDRYVASTSPPDHSGCLSSYNDYEVEVVEIRVKEGEFANIIP